LKGWALGGDRKRKRTKGKGKGKGKGKKGCGSYQRLDGSARTALRKAAPKVRQLYHSEIQ